MTRYVPRLLLIALLLLATGHRFYRLDAQSFWNDDGNSARIAERAPGLILEGAAGDIHPPGYYLLLHYWRAVFGHSEYMLRALSAVAGVTFVAFTYLLGRRIFGEASGLIAAFLSAISPFAIYYSQEARMYALLSALSAISTYLFLRILANTAHPASNTQYPRLGILAVYVLLNAAGLYTHYAFPLVLIFHNVAFGAWWLTVARQPMKHWRWVALWAGVQAAIAILYLPWLPTALESVTGWSPAGREYELGPALLDVLRVLSVGITLPVEKAAVPMAGLALMVLAGLCPRRADRKRRIGVAVLALSLLLPVVLIFALDLYKPEWRKFLVVVLPPFYILIAHGTETLARFLTPHSPFSNCLSPRSIRNSQFAIRLLAITLFFLAVAPSLRNLYFNPAYARDDYRQIAADIAASARPGDAVILNAPNQWEVFTYYYPDQDVYPAPYRPKRDRVEEFLSSLTEQYLRLFVLYWGDAESDPQRLVETLLSDRAYKAGDRWYGRVRLVTYGVAPLPDMPAVALDTRFGEIIRLRGYAVAETWFAPGDILPVTLFWEAQAPIGERYKVTVQLLNGTGQLAAQHDSEPGDGLTPTTSWVPSQAIADRYGVFLPPDLPPGRYTLIVGLYDIATGERLPLASGDDHVVLCDVEVRSPAAGATSINAIDPAGIWEERRSDHACPVCSLMVDSGNAVPDQTSRLEE